MANRNIKFCIKEAPKYTRTKDTVIKRDIFYTSAFDKYYFNKVMNNKVAIVGGEIIFDEDDARKLLNQKEIIEYESELKSKLRRKLKYYTDINVCFGYSVRSTSLRFLYIDDDENQGWVDCKEADRLIDISKDTHYEGLECYRKKFCRVILLDGKRYIVPIQKRWGSNCIEEAKQVVLENYLFEEEFYLVNPRKKQQYTIKLKQLNVKDRKYLVKTKDDTYTRRFETVGSWMDDRRWKSGILLDETRDLLKENHGVELFDVYCYWV